MRLVVIRTYENDRCTLGDIQVWNGMEMIWTCKTIERPWVNNKNNISRIPAGVYDIVYEYSPKFRRHLYELKGVPGRSEVKIHIANYVKQLEGCIGVGHYFTDLDKDGVMDVANSANTLDLLHKKILPVERLKIVVIDP